MCLSTFLPLGAAYGLQPMARPSAASAERRPPTSSGRPDPKASAKQDVATVVDMQQWWHGRSHEKSKP